jgi:hypothetical protein
MSVQNRHFVEVKKKVLHFAFGFWLTGDGWCLDCIVSVWIVRENSETPWPLNKPTENSHKNIGLAQLMTPDLFARKDGVLIWQDSLFENIMQDRIKALLL